MQIYIISFFQHEDSNNREVQTFKHAENLSNKSEKRKSPQVQIQIHQTQDLRRERSRPAAQFKKRTPRMPSAVHAAGTSLLTIARTSRIAATVQILAMRSQRDSCILALESRCVGLLVSFRSLLEARGAGPALAMALLVWVLGKHIVCFCFVCCVDLCLLRVKCLFCRRRSFCVQVVLRCFVFCYGLSRCLVRSLLRISPDQCPGLMSSHAKRTGVVVCHCTHSSTACLKPLGSL